MARDEFIERLRSYNQIEDVMSSYVSLKRAGRNFVCVCPFHSDKNPSCTVFTDTQSFYCFGCQAGGDVITFIEKIENVEFPDAVKILAERAGLEVPEYNGKSKSDSELRTKIYEMNRLAANYYYVCLTKGENSAGRDYFAMRKISPQTIRRFGLGYAPDAWDMLTKFLKGKGYTEDEMEAAWLGKRTRNGGFVDMFRNRVMFPIVNKSGNIIGFGGRVLDDSKPKYLNTGETKVFDKGRNLFSYNHARESDLKQIILCEGYMDVIALDQAGFPNSVATLGTAITPEQARLIRGIADEVIISYDIDYAGQTAAVKAIRRFNEAGVKARVLKVEDAKDPDEYLKKFGDSGYRHLISKAQDAMSFLLDRNLEGCDMDTPEGRTAYLEKCQPILQSIFDTPGYPVYSAAVAERCRIPQYSLDDMIKSGNIKTKRIEKKKEWRNIRTNAAPIKDDINPDAIKFRKESGAEEQIICYLLRKPDKALILRKDAPPEIFVTAFHRKVYGAILENMSDSEYFSLSLLAEVLTPDEMGRISGIIARHDDVALNDAVIHDCISVLKKHKDAPPSEDISDEELRRKFSSKKH